MLGAQLPPPLHFSFPRGCHFLISELHISKWHTSVTASWLFSFRHYPWTSIGGVEDVALPLPRHSPITCRPPPPSRPRVILWCGGSGLSANIVLMEQVLFRTVIRSVHFGVQFLHFFFLQVTTGISLLGFSVNLTILPQTPCPSIWPPLMDAHASGVLCHCPGRSCLEPPDVCLCTQSAARIWAWDFPHFSSELETLSPKYCGLPFLGLWFSPSLDREHFQLLLRKGIWEPDLWDFYVSESLPSPPHLAKILGEC